VWLHCDGNALGVLRDTIINARHSLAPLQDPWLSCMGRVGTTVVSPVADLWWRVEDERDWLHFAAANACADRRILLKCTADMAGLERAGGSVHVRVKSAERIGGEAPCFIASTTVRIPKRSGVLRESVSPSDMGRASGGPGSSPTP
jgi:hypothetical protein